MSNIRTETPGEAKVFVLSPDLLEKLGINLCNISQTVQQSQKSKRENNKHCIKNAPDSNHEVVLNNVSNSQDSSILETANLMKNSVFLSPTFIPTVGDTITGEVNNVEQIGDLYATRTIAELNNKDNNNHCNQENVILESNEIQNDTYFDYKQPPKDRILKETDPSVICNGRLNIQSQWEKYDCNEINKKKNFDDVKSKLKCLKACDGRSNVSKGNLQCNGQVPDTKNNFDKESKCLDIVPTLDSLECRLESGQAFITPVSRQPDMERSLNLNGIDDNSHNVIDKHQSFITQDICKTNDHLFRISELSAHQSMSTADSHISNVVNIDIIKYAGCDESVDMELDRMLHETEILIPVLSTDSTNMISNMDVVDKEILIPSHRSPYHGKELHNVVEENDILISLPPELENISNITQNMGNTQDINIDILYESFDEHGTSNETEITNFNQELKPMFSNLVICDTEQHNQSNGIDKDIINHIESDETSDMELDIMLREKELLISTSSNTSICDSNQIKLNNVYELPSEKEVDDVFKGNEIMGTILECNNFVMKERTNSYLSHTAHVIEDKGRNIIITHNGSINKFINNDTAIRIIDSLNPPQLNTFSTTSHNNSNIGEKNVKMLECIMHSSKNSANFYYDQPNELNCYTNDEQKLRKGMDDVATQNNFINGFKQNKLKDLENLSIEITKTNLNDPGENCINNKETENNNNYHSPDKIMSSNQYQNIDSLEKPGSNGDVSSNSIQNKDMESAIENKVQEIANYLKKAYQNKCDVKLFKPQVGIHTKSKIFIQGVEKPGGSDDHKLVFNKCNLNKTYEIKKKKQLHVDVKIEEIPFESTKKPEEHPSEINTCIEPSLFIKSQEFCLCGDFGKLTFDEYNNFYEHIHFESNRSVNCPVNTLFEIYNEQTGLIPYEIREYDQEKEIYYECDSGHICWQKFEYQEDANVSKIDIEAIEKSLNKTGESVDVPDSVLIPQEAESACTSRPKEIEDNKANCDNKVSNEINENLVTEVMIKDNAVASQNNAESKEMENNMSLDQRYTKKYQQPIKNSIDELKRNLPEYEGHISVAVMDSTTDVPGTVSQFGDSLISRKRKIINDLEEPPAKRNVKCGVCEQMFAEAEWEDHISKVHDYIAWKDGYTIDLENLLLLKKLKMKLKNKGSLICTFCGFEYVKLTKFISHVKKCFSRKVPKYNLDSKERVEEATASKSKLSICGVCRLEISDVKWIEHISEEHQYLAWKEGETPLDLGDENKMKDHLLNIVKNHGHLVCVKCGLLRKYTAKTIKNYQLHIDKCNVKITNQSRTSQRIKSEQTIDESVSALSVYKCAVCEKNVDASKWADHVSKQHNYRAWIYGEEPPNFDDDEVLRHHLHEISKREGGLRCSKCGVIRKYVKSYLQHIRSCKEIQNDNVGGKVAVQVEKSHTASSDVGYSKNTPSIYRNKSRHNVSNNDLVNNEDVPSSSKEDIQNDILSSNTVNSTDDISNKLHTEMPTSDVLNSVDSVNPSTCTCGMCGLTVQKSKWIDHIGEEHNYIAWKSGETPLNSDDDKEIWQHLYNIVNETGKLICAKCGIERKYPKSFLHHMRDCPGPDTSFDNTNIGSVVHADRYFFNKNLDSSVTELKCGVCQEVSARDAWIAHMKTAHDYIAWIDGEAPLDTNNQDMLREHLQKLVDEIGSLECAKCGTSRKFAKKFMQHVQQCSGDANETVTCGACKKGVRIDQWMSHIRTKHNYIACKNDQAPVNTQKPAQVEKRLRALVDKIKELICPKCGYKSNVANQYLQHSESCTGNPDYEKECSEATELEKKDFYQCALCQGKIKIGDWKKHAIDKHYNVAWVVGDEPIDLHNPNIITKTLKEYLKYGKFVCKVCGTYRASATGFYAHFVACGLSEEESDKYKMSCEICGSKYLGIYKYQHIGLHTQQEMARERKEKADELRASDRARQLRALAPVAGPRRAAAKARMVIEETVRQYMHVCQTCSFATDVKEEMSVHKCPKRRKMSEDIDLSIEQEESSDDDDVADEVEESDDANYVEVDEEDNLSWGKRKHHESHSASARITRIPFAIPKLNEYLLQNAKDNADHYLTKDTLFPQWTQCHYEVVQESEILERLPPLEESCQVYSNKSWQKYKRWQAILDKEKATIFVGYSIQRLSWLPAHLKVAEHHHHNLLAVACHSGDDCPHLNFDDLSENTTLIQIWDFQDFQQTVPKLVMGLVIPFGTVWAMDWCPSGARECLKESQGFVRMGLLAVACSNGTAYILSVPYPSTVVTSGSIFCKLEPVAQLKFTMKSDRQIYQATSICWSKQKGHSTVIVGYSDGSTAYYDLNTESPFLKAKDNSVTVFYPFYDEQLFNGCITDVSTFPAAQAARAPGALCAAAAGGSALLAAGAARGGARVHSHLAASSAAFLPAWPAVFLAGEDVITNTSPNELEYWGFGRRAGPAQASGGCALCGLLAAHMAPFLRLLRPHHARSDLNKIAIARIGTKQLAKKRKRNEDKKDAAETFTYKDAILKYGIEFKLVSKTTTPDEYKASISNYKEVEPERFPLAAVPSMAFCTSPKHHKQLAVATHAGIIFVLNV